MTQTKSQDEETVELIDLIYSLRNQFEASNHNSQHEQLKKNAVAQLHTYSRKLMLVGQDPNAAFWELVRRDMGVFRHLNDHGSASANELASISGAEESLIVRILRPLVAEGLLLEVDDEVYKLTNRGTAFGLPAYDDSISFAIEFMPIVLSNPTFFRNNGYHEPCAHEGLNTPLASYFQRPDYGLFDYLRDNPVIQAMFISSMKAQVRSTHLSSSVYPYQQKLSASRERDEAPIGIVDIGGSQGELLQEIKASCPGINGRMIVQDRAETFDSMVVKREGIELMAHDILTEQPIKGARVYHMKRILHDWADDKCRIILKHTVSAMDRDWSILLIMDAVLPMRNASFSQAMGDHSMLTFGGKERSEKQWKELLASVGLGIVKIYRGPEPEAVLECRKL
ncbi:O-methyltransferase domain-containing protein [Trichoderma sp. SZMC 28012]